MDYKIVAPHTIPVYQIIMHDHLRAYLNREFVSVTDNTKEEASKKAWSILKEFCPLMLMNTNSDSNYRKMTEKDFVKIMTKNDSENTANATIYVYFASVPISVQMIKLEQPTAFPKVGDTLYKIHKDSGVIDECEITGYAESASDDLYYKVYIDPDTEDVISLRDIHDTVFLTYSAAEDALKKRNKKKKGTKNNMNEDTCLWIPFYMFGRHEGYIRTCIDNPHHNRVYDKKDICPNCGKPVQIDELRRPD